MSRKIAWPANNAPADFDDMAAPFRELLLRLYPTLDPQEAVPVREWNGLPLNYREGATCGEPPQYFSEAGLKRQAEQGRDALDSFIGCVIRVAMEQGRRSLVGDELMQHALLSAARELRKSTGTAVLGDVIARLAGKDKVKTDKVAAKPKPKPKPKRTSRK